MQTTADLLKKFKVKQQPLTLTKCSGCKTLFDFKRVGFTSRAVEDLEGVDEVGIECPKCKVWIHSFFISTSLSESRPGKGASRQERREYQRRFNKFNEKTRKRLGMKQVEGRWQYADVSDRQGDQAEADEYQPDEKSGV